MLHKRSPTPWHGFNYLTYSRHVFRDAGPPKMRFVLSFAVNYLASAATLTFVAQLVENPYGAGIIASLIVSAVNYFALKFVVFKAPSS